MVKVTFTVDEETVATLRRSAERLRKPQSAIVREAIAVHAERVDRLTARERVSMLRALDTLTGTSASRPAADVDAELVEIRASRRAAGQKRARRGEPR